MPENENIDKLLDGFIEDAFPDGNPKAEEKKGNKTTSDLSSFFGKPESNDKEEEAKNDDKEEMAQAPEEEKKSSISNDKILGTLGKDKEDKKVEKTKKKPPKKTTENPKEKVQHKEVKKSNVETKDSLLEKALNGEFDLSPSKHSNKVSVVITGEKGSGKTTGAISGVLFEGTMSAISMDRMTEPISSEMFGNKDGLVIYDGLRLYNDMAKDKILISSQLTVDYLNLILDRIQEEDAPDWILWDCSEKLQVICEMRMRKENGLTPFGGISNPNVWKERNMYMDAFFGRSFEIAKKGVIYTLYKNRKDIYKNGAIIDTENMPKWCGNLVTQTFIMLSTAKKSVTGQGMKYFLHCDSSKVPSFVKTGEWVDVTVV